MQSLRDQRLTSTSSPDREDRYAATRARIKSILAPMAEESAARPGAGQSASASAEPISHGQFKTKRGRFRRTVTFFTLLFIRTLAWEVFIRRFMGEKFVARGRSARWRKYARRFRALAIDMGGVMIKLGQFVSSRVDVLPPEITDELAGLQDQVPVVDFGYIKHTVERELGPIERNFLWFNPEPVAAASFGQVHRAQLHTGDRVVVKVQRPNITEIVKTDLAALRFVARLAMRYKPIRRRANVPALLEEFATVLFEEIDYIKEADNALKFASMFADDMGIYVPSVYLKLTTRYVLTLEDVTSIKLNDYAGIERAGISRQEVARRLLNCYLRQIFDFKFFHADPHPGNLFVYPIPEKYLNGAHPYERSTEGHPFYLIFIDFGMTGHLTPAIVQGLRQTLIAIITQDARSLVDSYSKLGVLMPGADKQRIEEATRAVFDKVWGLNMDEITNLPFEEVTDVAWEFSDLLLSMPFQMPQDFIYLSRSVSILSGMCTGLDPRFDPWREMQPFTQRLLAEGSADAGLLSRLGRGGILVQALVKSVRDFAARAYRLPALADDVLTRADRGDLVVQVKAGNEFEQQAWRIESAVNRLAVGVMFATVALVSTLLYLNGERDLGTVGYIISALLFVMIVLRRRPTIDQ